MKEKPSSRMVRTWTTARALRVRAGLRVSRWREVGKLPALGQAHRRLDGLIDVGDHRLHKRRAVRRGNRLGSDSHDRSLEIGKKILLNHRGNFGWEPADHRSFVEDEGSLRFRYRVNNCFFVQRRQRTQIDDFDIDALLL